MEDKVQPASLEFSDRVKLSELTNEDEYVNISISVEGEDGKVALSTVNPDSLEYVEGFRNGYHYTISFDAKKANPTEEELDEGTESLNIEAFVGPFDGKYTPELDEGIERFIKAVIRGAQKPDTAPAAV